MPERKRPEKAPGATEAHVSRGRLALLGVPVLQIQTCQLRPIERKTAGILAYLTLEGPTPRSRLAGLLWPESSEATARNNLAQALRRLKQATGAELVRGADVLELLGLEVDVAALEVAHFAGRHAEVIQSQGRLLEGHDYDDCPDFDDWLLIRRERLADLRRDSLMALADELEQAGRYREALAYAERLLEHDLLSEVAHRRVMRLWYLSGDRPAALKAYDRCKAVLQRELGMAPLAETQALAAQIAQGSGLGQSNPQPRSTMPLSLLRPPVLVGREQLWAAMEEAYQKGQVVFLRGEPGVGKTRLATDFAASKGRVVLLAARPGDAAVPYSSYARSLRETFSERLSLAEALPAWVRRELARILPELDPKAPPPLVSEADKLRFYDALAELTLLLHEGAAPSIQVSDDAQYLDPASLEAMLYQLNKYGGVGKKGQPPFTIEIYRRGEISSAIEQGVFYPLVERGLAVLLDVEPLQPAEVETLVGSLEVAGLPALAPALVRYAGGNPFFVLETARSLVESGALQKGIPQKLPASGKVRTLIQRRLERLSPLALNLARTAAVAGTDFSVPLAARVLQTSPVAFSEPLAELQTAQVMQGHAFVHDLLYEATLGGIPASIKLYLHQQVAAFLEEQQTEPARIAGHWLEGGEALRAAPLLLEASRQADLASRTAEALTFAQQAVQIYREFGQSGLELEALWQVGRLAQIGLLEPLAEAVCRMEELATSPLEWARTLSLKSFWFERTGRLEEGLRVAREGLVYAEQAGDVYCQAELKQYEANLCTALCRWDEAMQAQQAFRRLALAWNYPEAIVAALLEEGKLSAYLDHHREALELYRQGMEALEQWGQMLSAKAQIWNLMARSWGALGELPRVQEAIRQAVVVVDNYEVSPFHQTRIWLGKTQLHLLEADYKAALQSLGQARAQNDAAGWSQLGAWVEASLYHALGRKAEATAVLEPELLEPQIEPYKKVLLQTLLWEITGRGEYLPAIEALLPQMPGQHLQIGFWLAQARWADAATALGLARQALRAAQAAGLKLGAIQAELACAGASLKLGQPQAALPHSQRALEASRSIPHLYLQALWMQAQVLAASHSQEADHWLQQATELLELVCRRVPPEDRVAFV
ncbi:MAG: AAA family ATPase, partial [Meiothermus sp.]|nr:AAA family ATPase [Meiothermus sp.]